MSGLNLTPMSVLSCCLRNSASIHPSSGDDILIVLWRTSPHVGLYPPSSGSRRFRPSLIRACQALATVISSELMARIFLSDWNEGCVCVCVCVFSAKRQYGVEEHAFCTPWLGFESQLPSSTTPWLGDLG